MDYYLNIIQLLQNFRMAKYEGWQEFKVTDVINRQLFGQCMP